jgi:hypothetical protein
VAPSRVAEGFQPISIDRAIGNDSQINERLGYGWAGELTWRNHSTGLIVVGPCSQSNPSDLPAGWLDSSAEPGRNCAADEDGSDPPRLISLRLQRRPAEIESPDCALLKFPS